MSEQRKADMDRRKRKGERDTSKLLQSTVRGNEAEDVNDIWPKIYTLYSLQSHIRVGDFASIATRNVHGLLVVAEKKRSGE